MEEAPAREFERQDTMSQNCVRGFVLCAARTGFDTLHQSMQSRQVKDFSVAVSGKAIARASRTSSSLFHMIAFCKLQRILRQRHRSWSARCHRTDRWMPRLVVRLCMAGRKRPKRMAPTGCNQASRPRVIHRPGDSVPNLSKLLACRRNGQRLFHSQ